MPLIRSRSMPGVSLGQGLEEDSSTNDLQKDSGFALGSEPHSFLSDPRSSVAGDIAFPLISEPPSELDVNKEKRGEGDKEDPDKGVTIGRHYYPEGGWGWVILSVCIFVNILVYGLHQGLGVILMYTTTTFRNVSFVSASWLGAMSISLALFISPITIAVCRRKSTRLTAVLGGLVTALGCLFTSFASHYHQLFFSYGAIIGVGVGMTKDSSSLMVGQYFKRKREFVEIIVVSSSGLGISIMSAFVHSAVGSHGWRLGLQAVTIVVALSFFLGSFYRSASLYHPQRRAILHLKNQKRKVKEKNRHDEKPPFFDTTTLKSRTIQVLLVSISLSSFGISTPVIYLANQAKEDGIPEHSVLLLQIYLGLGWAAGCIIFGFLVVQKSQECLVGRQYLCQASLLLCGLVNLALTAVEGYHGYVLFAWLYGIFCGGFHYTLKMFTYEKVRARNFARTWGYVQCSQALPTVLGVPIAGYINVGYGNKAGYYFSSTLIIFGSMTIFLIDVHRRHAAKHRKTNRTRQAKHGHKDSEDPKERKDSLTNMDQDETLLKLNMAKKALDNMEILPDIRAKPELTCISEEGIADMDLPDHMLDELEYLGDCITSCDKVENYLMMSEFENNMIKTGDVVQGLLTKRPRRRLFSFKHSISNTGAQGGKERGTGPVPQSTEGGEVPDNAGVVKRDGSPKAAKDELSALINGGDRLSSSLIRSADSQGGGAVPVHGKSAAVMPSSSSGPRQRSHLTPIFANQKSNLKSGNFRTISVIEEASV